jgi:hypothetical protein
MPAAMNVSPAPTLAVATALSRRESQRERCDGGPSDALRRAARSPLPHHFTGGSGIAPVNT